MGGFVGQQVLTSITGKFTPIQQWVKQKKNFYFIFSIIIF
jgi:hypothetical protein